MKRHEPGEIVAKPRQRRGSAGAGQIDGGADECVSAWKKGSASFSVQLVVAHHAGVRRRTRSRSSLARPYIWRFTSLSLVICPSVWPFDHGSTNAAITAARSALMPLPNELSRLPAVSACHRHGTCAHARVRAGTSAVVGPTSVVLGVARRDEPRPLAARSRSICQCHRMPPADLRPLYRGFRYRRSDRRETASGRAGRCRWSLRPISSQTCFVVASAPIVFGS
jgi:hypothetical protein